MIVYLQKEVPNIKESVKLGIFGNVKYRVKKYQESEKYYKQSLEMVRDTNNLTGYSLTLIRLNKFKEADEFLKGIISKQLEDLIPLLNYGFSLTIQKRYDEAKNIFEQAEKIDSKDPILFFRWADFYAAQNKDKEAIESIKKAFDLGFKDLWRFEDEEFENLRKSPDFQSLITTYFKKK